ncbi:MFS transporter [Protomyces lactucae-debilis]|uniref:MFS transporter n=1 Tax=Protomyces lactucae-debilis TaxID=2754530 RepID=A0A1Y2EZJ7_PROLT|nr:MFS transporter [Protomyces lactucae-debilis]ORY77003.1 MFS transporter [Protomyces lactucae-debilis]
MGVAQYLKSRVTELNPERPIKPTNPFKVLATLNASQWNNFLLAFCCWTWDAVDFFVVSLTVTDVAKSLGKSTTDITWGITLVLMLRSVGAIITGLVADIYGRKYIMAFVLIMFSVLEIGLGFVHNMKEFLIVRALFGIAMGSMSGLAQVTALESAPPKARTLLGGLLQQGYSTGYLLATCFARGFVDTKLGWRGLAFFTSGPPILLVIWRLLTPETDAFLAMKAQRMQIPDEGGSKVRKFAREGKMALRNHGGIFTILVFIMIGFNFSSHASQDLLPTYLKQQRSFDADWVTITMCMANLGAICGGFFFGWLAQFMGKRLTMMITFVLGAALLPAYALSTTKPGIVLSFFFEQFAVQGGWSVVPTLLLELAPPQYRTFVAGTAYQLGNLASSASSTIESTVAQQYPLPGGKHNYGKVIGILMGCVFSYLLVVIFLAPERAYSGLAASDALQDGEDDLKATTSNRSDVENKGTDDHIEYVTKR